MNKKIRFLYDKCYKLSPRSIQISLGIKKVFPHFSPHTLNLVPPRAAGEWMTILPTTVLKLESFGSTTNLCPEGTTMMTVRLPVRYDYWIDLKKK